MQLLPPLLVLDAASTDGVYEGYISLNASTQGGGYVNVTFDGGEQPLCTDAELASGAATWQEILITTTSDLSVVACRCLEPRTRCA